MRRHAPGLVAFTLVELLVVIGLMSLLIALLLPALSRMRSAAVQSKMGGAAARQAMAPVGGGVASADVPATAAALRDRAVNPGQTARNPAQVHTFDATVDLTPRLSVGTLEPESIYEAKLAAKLTASAQPNSNGEVELALPLPPQVISLADLSVTVDGEPSDAVRAGDGELVWHGRLPGDRAAEVELTYAAVGKGVYSLQTPAGRIVDRFALNLTAHGSDVRMLELSMQPTGLSREPTRTVYTWAYKRLMFGRAISLDVLGIAPIDRLGELSWLGPLSVVFFGALVGLVARAFHAAHFDRWALLLVIGTFTATYPLMYFAQQFLPLRWAILLPACVTLHVIAWRALPLLGARLAALGVVLPGAGLLTLALCAAVQPNLQGMLLTVGGVAFFVAAMTLLPRTREERAVVAPLATAV